MHVRTGPALEVFRICLPTLILATGIGICTAPTTSLIMGAVPDEKQGVASAVNDTSREMGGALGIAVAGSILAGRDSTSSHRGWRTFRRRSRSRPRLAGQSRRGSRQAWPPGRPTGRAPQDRVPDGLHASTITMAVIVGLAAVPIGLWAPGRDGRQIRIVRRLLNRRPAALVAGAAENSSAGRAKTPR